MWSNGGRQHYQFIINGLVWHFLLRCYYYGLRGFDGFHIALVFIFSLYMALNVTVNFRSVETLDVYWRKPREALQEFSKNAGFSLLKDGDVVVIGRNVPHYVNANIIYEVTGLNVYVPSDDHSWFPEFPSPTASSYEIVFENGEFPEQNQGFPFIFLWLVSSGRRPWLVGEY